MVLRSTVDRPNATACSERRLTELGERAASPPPPFPYRCGAFRLTPSAAGHKAAVRQAVDYIWPGDIFQANICLRAEAEFDGDPLDAFCAAATVLRPPYAAFITTPGGAVASLSPELFLRRTGGTVISRPIKGTAHRPDDTAQATRQRGDLKHSAKNRAENVMIVDLVRNDLSRVCVPGTVTVPSLLGAEPHPGVWHRVSEVRGTLPETGPDAGASDGDPDPGGFPARLGNWCPQGAGARGHRRARGRSPEVYTGAIGYRSPVAGLELNVAIRTFEFAARPSAPGTVWLGVGGGIVADSGEEDEYAECLLKAGPLIPAIGSRPDCWRRQNRRPICCPARPRVSSPRSGSAPDTRRTSKRTSPAWPPAPKSCTTRTCPPRSPVTWRNASPSARAGGCGSRYGRSAARSRPPSRSSR